VGAASSPAGVYIGRNLREEDVSKTAAALAGFDEAEADKLRKVIAKKAGGAKLAAYEKQFFERRRMRLLTAGPDVNGSW
jgi:hypothetical protein